MAIPFVGSHITLIWLPTGIAVAVLLRWGYNYWPGIFLGALATNFTVDYSPILDSNIALGNTLGPLLTVWLLRRSKFHTTLEHTNDILLLVVAAAIGVLLSATGGTGSLVIFKVLAVQDARSAWVPWWMGDFIGVLLAAPLLLNISRTSLAKLWEQRLEFSVWCIATLAVSYGVFFSNTNSYSFSSVFVVFPLIIWSAMRFGVMCSSLSVLLLAIISAVATGLAKGPFYTANNHEGLFLLWLFTVTLILIAQMVAALQTENKRGEEELRKSEARTKLILDMSLDAVISADQEGRVIGWNREAESIFGYAADWALGKFLVEIIVPPALRKAHQEGMQRFVKTACSTIIGKRIEITGMRADGSEISIELAISATQWQGRYFFHAFVRDITERKRNQRLLEMMKFSIDHMGDKVTWVTPDAKVVYANISACNSLGYTKEEMLKLSVPDFDPDFPTEEWPVHWEQLKKYGSFTFETRHRTKSGEIYPVEVSINYISFDNEEFNFAYARDISKRKQAEAELRIAATAFESQESLMITDAESVILRVNKAFTETTGYTAEEVVGQTPRIFKSGRHDEAFYRAMWEAIQSHRNLAGRNLGQAQEW